MYTVQCFVVVVVAVGSKEFSISLRLHGISLVLGLRRKTTQQRQVATWKIECWTWCEGICCVVSRLVANEHG